MAQKTEQSIFQDFALGQIPKMTVHQKLLIKKKVLNQIWWSWCYYNEEKMFYPARWKKITVDQNKEGNMDFSMDRRFFGGHPVYCIIISLF